MEQAKVPRRNEPPESDRTSEIEHPLPGSIGSAGAHEPNATDLAYLVEALHVATHAHADPRLQLQQALDRLEVVLGAPHPALIEAAQRLALLAVHDGDSDRYVEFQSRANQLLASFDAYLLGPEAEQAWSATRSLHYQRALATAFSALKLATPEVHRLAMETVLLCKSRLLDTARKRLLRLEVSDQIRLDLIAGMRARIARHWLAGHAGTDVQGFLARLSELRGTLEAKTEAGSAKLLARIAAPGLDEVQSAIPASAALMEYVLLTPLQPGLGDAFGALEASESPRYGACVLHAAGPPRCVDLGDAESVDRGVADLLALLADGDLRHPSSPEAAARKVEAALLAPLRGWIGSADFLIIAPDAELNLVPFGALVDEEGRYLLERSTVNLVSSGRDLVRVGNGLINPGRPLVVGSLAETELEVEQIGALFPGATQLEGPDASEGALKRRTSPHILHIAAPGFLLPSEQEDPMHRSGLALAGFDPTQGEAGPGALTALEVSQLRLAGTELVVLSAVEIGPTGGLHGAEIASLRQAFTAAGAASLVTSLWNLPSPSVRRLMEAFYRRLLDGEPKATALRGAQLELLRSSRWAHPSFWAGFMPSGDSGPLAFQPVGPVVAAGPPKREPSENPDVADSRFASDDSFEVVALGLEVVERNEDAWQFHWSVTIRNQRERDLTLEAALKLLDADNVGVDEVTRRLVLPAATEQVFSGDAWISASDAPRVSRLNAKVHELDLNATDPQ